MFSLKLNQSNGCLSCNNAQPCLIAVISVGKTIDFEQGINGI